jgi:hypothetical protein
MTRRCSARREELDGVDDQLDCFQKKEMRSAGDGAGGRSFGFYEEELDLLRDKSNEGRQRGTGARGREWARRGSVWFTVDGGFERICPQTLRTPASDFAGLAAL